ncbi:MAG: CHAD domain-containing protein [Synechococcaceae cyanobacterium]|nr:CHAD domain-containing protein [Synechococcaceae cyanobacterium]
MERSALAPAPDRPPAPAADLSNGAFALALITAQTERLRRLRPAVLNDAEHEPLHQLRVSLRRLRTALRQFGPALVLPERVSERRIAALARRTSLCRDLDVLRDQIEDHLLPLLPAGERRALRPLLQQLHRRRRRAFAAVVEALEARRSMRLLERLEAWVRRPVFTALGEEPFAAWRSEWHRPFSAGLFLHPGWWATQPQDPALHGLRKRIKGVRYSLEPLVAPTDPSVQAWIDAFKRAQSALGALQDLQVFQALLLEGPVRMEGLAAELERQRAQAWAAWGDARAQLLRPECRRALPSLSPWPEPAGVIGAGPAAAGS